MQSLLDKFLALLGYYNLSADQFFNAYGYDYYIMTIQQLSQRIQLADSTLIDVASNEIAQAITVELQTTDPIFEVIYDFAPLFATNTTPVLQQQRVIDGVLNDLETKGYKVYGTAIPTQVSIRWKFTTFRMFKRNPLN